MPPPIASLPPGCHAGAMPRMRQKQDLPQKICAWCGRSFSWRRKWARDWEQVRYCSDACRAGKTPRARTDTT